MKFKSVSIVIPCYNESSTIKNLLHRVISADSLGLRKEIIVIDDASTDGSLEILHRFGSRIKLISKKTNSGKGAALKSGFLISTGDIVLVQDADLEYDPAEYPLLLEPIISGKADVVYGSRFLGARPHRVVYYWHAVANWLLTTLSNMFTNINLTDMETCYKAIRGDMLRQITSKLIFRGFGFEPEITARLAKIPGIRFYEVGISYYGRTYAEGKHIRWIDALKAILVIIRINLFG